MTNLVDCQITKERWRSNIMSELEEGIDPVELKRLTEHEAEAEHQGVEIVNFGYGSDLPHSIVSKCSCDLRETEIDFETMTTIYLVSILESAIDSETMVVTHR
jgi:hypothetical protein